MEHPLTPETLLMIKVQIHYLHLSYLYYMYMVCAHYVCMYVCMYVCNDQIRSNNTTNQSGT